MFPRDAPSDPPPVTDGAAAQAIREAETALARQSSLTAQVDLQVVTAVLTAHAAQADGAAKLDALQREIEAAVTSRTDLDTPAGARSFQQYLIEKIRDIRAVVDDAALDATSKASLAAALASLYASSGQPAGEAAPAAEAPRPQPDPPPASPPVAEPPAAQTPDPIPPADLPLDDLPPYGDEIPLPPMDAPPAEAAPAAAPAAAPVAPPVAPAAPTAMPLGGAGLPPLSIPPLGPLGPAAADPALLTRRDPGEIPPGEEPPAEDDRTEPDTEPEPEPEPGNGPEPGPDPDLAQVISAAVSGTPIADAFDEQGIDIPDPGTPIADPVDPSRLAAGDVGVFTDRHALALGNGKALLDDQIQPIGSVNRPGFLGWHHPPIGTPDASPPPDGPAPTRPAETAD